MDAVALLSPPPVASASESTADGSAPKTDGDPFASHLADALGKSPENDADPKPTTAVDSSRSAPTGAVPPATNAVRVHASTKATAQRVEPKIDAPPESPPSKVLSEKGAPTQTPIARVERPDPTSDEKDAKTTDAAATNGDVLPATTLAWAVAATAVPTGGKVADTITPSTAPIVPKATVASPVASAPVPTAATKVVEPSSEASAGTSPKASPDPGAPTQGGLTRGNPNEGGPTKPLAAATATESIPSGADDATLPTAPTASAAKLPSATDLGVVPQVVQPSGAPAPQTLVAQAVSAQPVQNAKVARVAADRPAVKAVEASDKPTVSLKAHGNALLETAPTQAGDDAPSEGSSDASEDAPQDPTPQAPTAATARIAATERPEAGVSRPDVDRHLVVRQVADRIESLVASRPKDGVTVHLEPRDLGTVTLVVKGLQSALDVKVTASDDRVRQSLDSARPELAQALAPRGIELRQLSVSTAPAASSTSANPNGGGNAGSNPEGRPRAQTPVSVSPKASRAEGQTSAARSARSTGRGVDLLV